MLVLDDGKHYRNIEESMACVRAKALQSTVHAYTDSERIARKVAASKNPVRVLTGSEWRATTNNCPKGKICESL